MVESDSLLAVKKILGDVQRQDPHFALIRRCQQLLQFNWHCSITHLFREANVCADFLASSAMSDDYSVQY